MFSCGFVDGFAGLVLFGACLYLLVWVFMAVVDFVLWGC